MKKWVVFIILNLSLFSSYKVNNNKVYYDDIILEDVDIQSFQILSLIYAKDKNSVYSFDQKLSDIDYQTFTICFIQNNERIPSNYTKDKNAVYYANVKLEADIDSFIALENYYGKDKNVVFFEDHKLKYIDVKTFVSYEESRIINGISYNAEDKNNYYSFGKIVKKK